VSSLIGRFGSTFESSLASEGLTASRETSAQSWIRSWASFLDQRVSAEAIGRRSLSARPLLAIAPPVDSLNVVRVIISPRSTHPAGADVVRYDVAVVGEFFLADWTFAVLGNNFPVQ
jgi:hypothetical protein